MDFTVRSTSWASAGPVVIFRRLAQAAFFATVVLIPVRLRIYLLSRPNIPVQGDYTDFLLFAPDIAMLALLAFWGLSLVAGRQGIRLGPAYLWLPLAGTIVAGLLSSITSVDRALTFYHVARLTGLFFFFLYIVNEVTAPALIVCGVALQGILQAFVGIAQFLLQGSIGLQALGENRLDPSWLGVSIVSTGTDRILRAYGLTDHPNILGGCLAFGLILLLAAYFWMEWPKRLMVLIAFLPMTVALLLTFSRSAWLAFAVGALLLLVLQLYRGSRMSLKPLLWLALATGIALAPFVWQEHALLGIRLNAGAAFSRVPVEQQSIGERALLLQETKRLLGVHPLTGIGLGGSPIALKNENPNSTLDYQPPHMAPLEATLETGLLGEAFYLLLLVLPWVVLLRHQEILSQPFVAGAAALLLAITVVGFFDYYTWLLVPGRLWQWLAWGFMAVSVQQATARHGLGAPLMSRSLLEEHIMLANIREQAADRESTLLRRAILHTLAYADVFDYPLAISEIHRYLSFQQTALADVQAAVDALVETCAVVQAGEWFALPGRQALAEVRQRRGIIAGRLWRKAQRYARIIAFLPYVRMVAVTGSLAMDNTEEGNDVDLMLVATPGRLWTVRALAVLVTRLAKPTGVRLCPNYVVTTDALEFHERSLYGAHEVTQMIPLAGADIYERIRSLNAWTNEFLPNAKGAPERPREAGPSAQLQPRLEAALSRLPLQWFEAWEMDRKIRKLSRQMPSNPEAYFSANVCKGHADRHGRRTELLLRQRLGRLGSI